MVAEGVKVSVTIGVGRYSDSPTTVSAAIVLMGLEKAESTMSCASRSDTSGLPGSDSAAAETMQIRLNPRTPAARTVNGAEYSRTFTLASLLHRPIQGDLTFMSE